MRLVALGVIASNTEFTFAGFSGEHGKHYMASGRIVNYQGMLDRPW